MFSLERLIIMIPPFLFAITIHEFSHGLAAFKLGDPTAYNAGRLTLNPIHHLDVFGTLMLFFVGFGWAKPVPINPYNLKNPLKDQLWISLAGPASNLISAFVFGMIIRLLGLAYIPVAQSSVAGILIQMVVFSLQLNIILAVFNLIPIPPLDGAHILEGVLPNSSREWLYSYEKYGSLILMGIIMLGFISGINIFGIFFTPFIKIFSYLFAGI